MPYDHTSVEKKWQKFWDENKTFKTENLTQKPKKYILDMFPYPSGAGLHVGHPKWYTATDIVSRYYHATGRNVLHTMGFDAFGLPAENYAIKTGTHPAITTAENIGVFTDQLKWLGFSYDWDRMVDTTDPEYYKWTQWIFLELFKKWLAYEQDLPINYCPHDKTGLANEEVINGCCERCGTRVERRAIRQWVLRITEYADRLLSDMDTLDWPEWIKEMQRNWIGRSEGCEFDMKKSDDERICISVYTTRVDTVFGMTYAVLAPDHPQVQDFITTEQKVACEAYIEMAKGESDQDRTNEGKEKTGVFTGSYVINPYNWESVPLWIADYVLGSYGTGAVMAVPAHDERDFEFAKKYNLRSPMVIAHIWMPSDNILKLNDIWIVHDSNDSNDSNDSSIALGWFNIEELFTEDWILFWMHEYHWISSAEARQIFTQKAESEGFGRKKINYKLRDWLFSRQRYWGEPIPLIHITHEDFAKLPCLGEYKSIPYLTLWGKSTPRTNENIKYFDPVNAIVKHWSNDSYIVLTFKNGEKWLVWGSVESGETREEAIVREVQEETGYKNIKIEKLVIPEIYSRWYKERKDLEEEARESIYFVQILNSEKVKSFIEEWIVSVDWIIWDEVENTITLDHHKFYWNFFYKAPFSYRVKRKNIEYLYRDGVEFSQVFDGLTGKIIIDSRLPLTLPQVEKYEPLGDGLSPLAGVSDWVNVQLADNLVGKRETNTMPQWGGSCWYYLRYMDPKNPDALASPEALAYWGMVDEYVGGAEHAVLHLLYARFWHKVLYDIGVVPHAEPFQKLTNVGMILAYAYERWDGGLVAVDLVEERDGKFIEKETGKEVKQVVAKMSKSLKNVVNPNDIIREYWADTLRLYEMSMSAFTDTAPWNSDAIIWVRRFLDKVYSAFTVQVELKNENNKTVAISIDWSHTYRTKDDMKSMKLLHKTIKKVGEDIVDYKFNTAISTLQILINEWVPVDPEFSLEWQEKFLILLHPFAPHIAEELWNKIWWDSTLWIYNVAWPEYDDFMLIDDEVTIAIQINGKLRGTYTGLNGVMQDEVSVYAHETPDIAKWLENKILVKEIFIPNKMLSIVIRDIEI